MPNGFDTVTERMYNRRVVVRDGQRKSTLFFVRVFAPTELKHLLEETGFRRLPLLWRLEQLSAYGGTQEDDRGRRRT